ncbi:unnamed protein product, partial [Mesorhabditis spiculigera]
MTESCYKLMTTESTFFEARKQCLAVGADLVSIHSAEEDQLVLELAFTYFDFPEYKNVSVARTWLGAMRNGAQQSDFFWWDGTTFDYTNWSETQPDNWQGQEFVQIYTQNNEDVYINPRYLNKWDDVSDAKAHNAVIFRNLFSLFNGIGYLRPWKVKHIEVLNITFEKDDLNNILRAFRKLRPISLTLLNCAYDLLTELERTRLAVGLTDGGRIQVIYIGRTSAVKQPLPGAITAKYDDKSLRVISEDEGEDEEDEDESGEVNIGETDDSGDEEMMCIVEDCQDDHGRAADARDLKSRWDHQDHCRSIGSNLTSVVDTEENNWLAEFAIKRGGLLHFWTGGRVAAGANMTWDDGQPSTIANWARLFGVQKPDNVQTEPCIEVMTFAPYKSRWNNDPCFWLKPAICKRAFSG